MSDGVNNQLVLVVGESGAGKSVSLRNMRNQPKGLYMGTEAGKRLPFRSKFDEKRITDPYQVREGLIYARNNPDKYEYVMVDSLTFLMDMLESQYVLTADNTMQGWSNYAQYLKTMLQDEVASLDIPVIFTAHVKAELDEARGRMAVSVPIKGSLKNNGVEAYFSTVVAATTIQLSLLQQPEFKDYDRDLLRITPQEEALGYKHVFQTQITRQTVGHRIRSPIGLFGPNQAFMDNDTQMLLDHLHAYYND